MRKTRKTRIGMLNLKLFFIFAVFTVIISAIFSISVLLIFSAVLSEQYEKVETIACENIAYTMADEHLRYMRNPKTVTAEEKENILSDMNTVLKSVSGNTLAIFGLDSFGKPEYLLGINYDENNDEVRFSEKGYMHSLKPLYNKDGSIDIMVTTKHITEIRHYDELIGYIYMVNSELAIS